MTNRFILKEIFATIPVAAALFAATPAGAAQIIGEVFVQGGAYDFFVSTSTDPDFTSRRSISLVASGVKVDTSVDLASGSLRGSINSLGSPNGGSFNASLSESIFFNIPGAIATTVTRAGFRIYFAGDMAVSGRTEVNLQTRLFGTNGSANVSLTSADFRPFAANGTGFSFPDLPVTRGQLGEISGIFDHIMYFDLVGPNPEIFLTANVQAFTAGNSRLDFGNSAHLGFVLPDGVTFTSGSGSAFTRSAFPGVPEPDTWAMMIIGLGSVGAASRRRRGSTAVAAV